MTINLPAPTENAGYIARITTALATVCLSVWIPEIGVPLVVAQSFSGPLIDRLINRPRQILETELRNGNINALDAEKYAAFYPMAYRFFESARQGEYEHNLKILGAFIASELKGEVPDPGNFNRIIRRVEGLTESDLITVSLIDRQVTTLKSDPSDSVKTVGKPYVTASSLFHEISTTTNIKYPQIQECLSHLTGRGFLLPDGSTRFDKNEEYYFTSESFDELIKLAKATIDSI